MGISSKDSDFLARDDIDRWIGFTLLTPQPKETIMSIDYITIEPQEFDPEEGAYTPDGECHVYGHGTYPNYSVLASQHRRTFLGSFPCLKEACEAYPDAEVGHANVLATVKASDCAPDWFDEADAGESW